MTDRRILLFLDTSTITAFTEGSIAVGEVMGEVADDQGLIGIPLLCLAEAAAAGADSDLVEVIVGNPATEVVYDEPAEWRALAATVAILGDLPASPVANAANDWDSRILTRTPELYEQLDGGGPIIAF